MEENSTRFVKVLTVGKRTGYAGSITFCKVVNIEEIDNGDPKKGVSYKGIKGPVEVGDIIEII